ncbi:jg35 [Pararge aegeria aegeria]|uniref:Jg35 protein n=1 Tax=Pararge aegeria aegeria TaxID=348720 RepID=A0A8S4QZU5_9NEOP|nr:jg35 [Pararge aegeria aegeria]
MVKENIVRKPACLRVLHNVLKGVHQSALGQRGGLQQPLLIVGGDPCSAVGGRFAKFHGSVPLDPSSTEPWNLELPTKGLCPAVDIYC